jgi:hypothetical protein
VAGHRTPAARVCAEASVPAGKRRVQNNGDTAVFGTVSSVAGLPTALAAASRVTE